ncbi:MAG: hypothetical protein ACI8YP_000623 [Algoriphagus sp.]|jgi:hypothetical protein
MDYLKQISRGLFKVISLLVFLLFFGYYSFAQKSLSISYGLLKIDWTYDGNFDALRTDWRTGWSVNILGAKTYANNLTVGIEASVNRYGISFQFDRMRYDLGEIHHFSVLPYIGYDHKLAESRFSTQFNLGIGIGFIPVDNKYYVNDQTFQIRRLAGKDANGNPTSRPLYDLTFSGSQEARNRFFALIKPNVQLSYSLNEKSALFLRAALGISLSKSVLERDFPEVVFENENHSVLHTTNFSFSALELGYRYTLK